MNKCFPKNNKILNRTTIHMNNKMTTTTKIKNKNIFSQTIYLMMMKNRKKINRTTKDRKEKKKT